MLDPECPRETRLSRELQQGIPSKRVAPRDVFDLAVAQWLRSERVEIGALAEELGVARATIFRWVGSRELLLGEVIWSIFESTWKYVQTVAEGVGADYTADVCSRLMASVLKSEPFRRFLEQDPEYALRILTSKNSVVRTRILSEVCTLLREQVKAGHIVPALKLEDLAYMIVRVFESCLYSDQIAGIKPNIKLTSDAVRILVAARPSPRTSAKRPRRRSSK